MGKINGFIGTYASENSKGVYRFTFDTVSGTLGKTELFYEAKDAKWISLYKNIMAVPVEKHAWAGTCLLDISDGKAEFLGEVLTEKHTPCYILQDETYVYTANYHEGLVMIYEKRPGQREALCPVKKIVTAPGAGCHQILFHGPLMLVPCLTLDRILCFDRTRNFEKTGELLFPENTARAEHLLQQASARVRWLDETPAAVSSSKIRKDLLEGKRPQGLSDAVFAYILESGLYTGSSLDRSAAPAILRKAR